MKKFSCSFSFASMSLPSNLKSKIASPKACYITTICAVVSDPVFDIPWSGLKTRILIIWSRSRNINSIIEIRNVPNISKIACSNLINEDWEILIQYLRSYPGFFLRVRSGSTDLLWERGDTRGGEAYSIFRANCLTFLRRKSVLLWTSPR